MKISCMLFDPNLLDTFMKILTMTSLWDTVSRLCHMKLILIDGEVYKAAEKIHG